MKESSSRLPPPDLPRSITEQMDPPQKEALRKSKRLLKKLLEE